MDAVVEAGRQYLRDHPAAGAAELGDALRRRFGLSSPIPEAPAAAPHVNEVAIAEQAWFTIRFWWWTFRERVFPRRPTATAEDVERAVAVLRSPSAEQGVAEPDRPTR